MSIINEIMDRGQKLNDTINEKIKLLAQRNSSFNEKLTNKLKDINDAIDNFRNTNLQGLTETKDKLEAVTKELQKTKLELENTKNELKRVTTDLTDLQNAIQQTNAEKTNFQNQINELEEKIRQMKMEYENKINEVSQEMSRNSEEDKKRMQEEFNANIADIEQKKNDLEKNLEETVKNQNNAINDLTNLQKEHEELSSKLVTVNEMLGNHIKQIETMINNTNQPDYGDYQTLLDTIQYGLTGVISEIKDAVLPTSTSVANSTSSTPLFDKFIKLSETDRGEIYDAMDQRYAKAIEKGLKSKDPGEKQNIDNILKRHYTGNLLKGGRRRRRTIKKRPKKTRKLMKKKQKGGYVYDNSKELDKVSSVISHSSGTSKSRSSTSSKRKRKRRTRKI
jgi:hypothetical protein